MVQVEVGAPRKVAVEGRLWSVPYRKVIRSTPSFSRAAAGFVFSHDLHGELTDDEQFKLATHARAVSPVTAYLAIEPGVRPSTAGIEEQRTVGGVVGGVSGGVLSSTIRPVNYWKKNFRTAKLACAAQYKPEPKWGLSIDLHMTYDEIVDITTSRIDDFGKCLVEAAQ